MFSTFRYLVKFRLWLCKYKIAAWIFLNFKILPIIRNDIEFRIVVGKGIKGRIYKTGEKASEEELNQVHAQYIAEIIRIH